MKTIIVSTMGVILAGCSSPTQTKTAPDSPSLAQLEKEFLNPPVTSRPRTWFHVMSGNMTKAGITKDLEAIESVGIGGVLLFNVTQGIPVGPVKFNSAEHIELISHMAAESERLGLAFGVHNSDGWTASGGPWISPENSMKKVVWSETRASGGPIDIKLDEPDTLENYYEDIATIAYPRLQAENETDSNRPVVTASDPKLDIDVITDGSIAEASWLETTEDSPAYIDFKYAEPFTLRAVRFRFMHARLAKTTLLSSNDGINFEPVAKLALRRSGKNDWGNDEALKVPVKAKHFRLQTNIPIKVQEVELTAVPSIGNGWGRTGAARIFHGKLSPIGLAPEASVIDSASIIDLSDMMEPGGRLKADLPKGDWTIMRFGQTSTGARNLPASAEGIGLEVDKFSKSAVKVHYDAYMKTVVNAVKDVAPNAHQYTEIDSYEVGSQNWTTGYDKVFRQKKGYDIIPFLPLYAGRFVDSAEVSERVTWDMRTVSNDLIRDNYYGYFTELANADGLKVYIEPYGNGPFSEIDAGGMADIPMGEFWVSRFGNRVHAAVSSGAIYEKPIISTEAFTDLWDVNWNMHPGYVKTLGDSIWALGVNEFMFHSFPHQANTHVKPGMTMNRWGSHFNRNQTWWDTAGKSWFEYLSRGQHLLRQGTPVNDALLFLGDGAPSTCPDKEKSNIVPRPINYICLNTDVLNNGIIAEKGAFKLPSGAAHKFLILENSETLSLETLNTLDRLSKGDGGLIIGKQPQHMAGFLQTADQADAFKNQVETIWSRESVLSYNSRDSKAWKKTLSDMNYRLDVMIDDRADLLFTHRKVKNHDIYFVYNDQKKPQELKAEFRVTGKKISLWNPITGVVSGVPSFTQMDNHTIVELDLDAQESVFVVFDGDLPADKTVLTKPLTSTSDLPLTGTWTVSFDAEYGSGKTIELKSLMDLKDHSDPDVKHYSGPITYRSQIEISDAFLNSGDVFMLNLGDVQIASTVSINGVEQGVTWIPPHQVDISKTLRSGQNSISVTVDNLWVNRLIGDAALPDVDGYTPARWAPPKDIKLPPMPQWYSNNEPPNLGKRTTFATVDFYEADDDLIPSGLIGPVTISKSMR